MLYYLVIFFDKQISQLQKAILGIITIQILQVIVITYYQPLLESIYLNKKLIPTEPESGYLPFDLSDLPDLVEKPIMKTQNGFSVVMSVNN